MNCKNKMEKVVPKTLQIRRIGFCGADDSVSPRLLQLLSEKYNWIEWGIIFGSNLEGTPRYPTNAWVNELVQVNRAHGSNMCLAAHLCQKRCHQVLDGDAAFVMELESLGFSRVQINATTAISVGRNPDRFKDYAAKIRSAIEAVPGIEFIFQLNSETQSVFDIISVDPPTNMSVLFDASCGLGIEINYLPHPSGTIPCGYAGGISPRNLKSILKMISDLELTTDDKVWIDMESSLRAIRSDKHGSDEEYFSIDTCFACIILCVEAGMPVASL